MAVRVKRLTTVLHINHSDMAAKKLIRVLIVSVVGGGIPSAAFQPSASRSVPSVQRQRWLSSQTTSSPSPTSLKFSFDEIEPAFIGGSFLWGLNLYYGFDWILAPLGTGLDSDFNAAYRTATFLGKVLAGESPLDAATGQLSLTIVDDEGDRPEMGSRIGSGANVGYAVAVENNEVEGADWLSDREAGLRSSAPFPLQFSVAVLYIAFGILAMSITESVQTAAVLAIPALVYEIGRPSLPTREEAIFDSKLDAAVSQFAKEYMVVYGEAQGNLPDGVSPVRRDEATNERELVNIFRQKQLQRSDSPLQNQDVSDFQIEMRMRDYGTGRSEAGYIKGIRLLRERKPEPLPWQ